MRNQEVKSTLMPHQREEEREADWSNKRGLHNACCSMLSFLESDLFIFGSSSPRSLFLELVEHVTFTKTILEKGKRRKK